MGDPPGQAPPPIICVIAATCLAYGLALLVPSLARLAEVSAIPIDRRHLMLAAGGLAVAPVLPRPAVAAATAADLALVLAADCSGSMRSEHYDLQQQGYAAAFRQKDVIRAITGGLHRTVAITYFQWSGYFLQHHSIPWTLLRTPADIEAFAATLEKLPRNIYSGGTSPAGAIEYGRRLLAELPAVPQRRVIDISGDGRSNNGPPPAPVRDAAVAEHITINGLPILHMEPDIDQYYAENVIGGPGAFMVPARDFAAFAEAIHKKLILEMAGTGQSAG
jgi:hypothetical protein